MIISEKQIMELISWTQCLCNTWVIFDSNHEDLECAAKLINDINKQQSTELKEIN